MLSGLSAAKCLINRFFRSNKNYCNGLVPEDLKIPAFQLCASTYHRIISQKTNQYDNRCKTIEIQFDHDLRITNNIELIILPDRFLDDADSRQTLVEMVGSGVDLRSYEARDFGPTEVLSAMNKILCDYFTTKGYTT